MKTSYSDKDRRCAVRCGCVRHSRADVMVLRQRIRGKQDRNEGNMTISVWLLESILNEMDAAEAERTKNRSRDLANWNI